MTFRNFDIHLLSGVEMEESMKNLRNVLMAVIVVMLACAVVVPRAEAAPTIQLGTVDDLLFGLYDYDNVNEFPTSSFTHNGLTDPDRRVLVIGYSEFPDKSILPNIYGYALGDGRGNRLR